MVKNFLHIQGPTSKKSQFSKDPDPKNCFKLKKIINKEVKTETCCKKPLPILLRSI